MSYLFFFFNDTATTEIYTLSLHDALPIFDSPRRFLAELSPMTQRTASMMLDLPQPLGHGREDRKSTRLNSSHVRISYAVFCLKKKKKKIKELITLTLQTRDNRACMTHIFS